MHDQLDVEKVGLQISDWYTMSHRDFPWRRTTNPWGILVSEMMLQQTRAEVVGDYFVRFMERFPSPESLAEAREDDVLRIWKGLGYYSRARNLKKTAELLVAKHEGRMPETVEDMRKLPGVGDYTAGAVMSIAFNKPVPAIDGNVLRVMARLMADSYDIGDLKCKQHFRPYVDRMIPAGRAHDYCQGIMELGATICIPSVPHCSNCPTHANCRAFSEGLTAVLPVKRKKERPIDVYWHTYCIRLDGMILMEKRGVGLLEGMVGLPQVESESDVPDPEVFLQRYGLHADVLEKLGFVRHVFTHRRWNMLVWEASVSTADGVCIDQSAQTNTTLFWHPMTDTETLAIPTAFQKVLNLISSLPA